MAKLRNKGVQFAILVAIVEAILFGFGLHANPGVQSLALFPTVLIGFAFWHHDKSIVLAGGFSVMLLLFFLTPRVMDHGDTHSTGSLAVPDMQGYLNYFANPHKAEVVYNLAWLLLGFALFARYFEKSGMSMTAAQVVMADIRWLRWLSPIARLLVLVFTMSICLDNIAAALIGGLILRAMYGGRLGDVPFALLVSTISMSNLGGAASFIGDTTTTLLYIAGVSPSRLARGFVGTVPAGLAIIVWSVWATKNQGPTGISLSTPDDHYDDRTQITAKQWLLFLVIGASCAFLQLQTGIGILTLLVLLVLIEVRRYRAGLRDDIHVTQLGSSRLDWPQLFPLLGIVGLVAGNLLFHQPGLGLWAGLLIGIVLGNLAAYASGRNSVQLEVPSVIAAVPGSIFLVLLVSCAKLLALHIVEPVMQTTNSTLVTYVAGIASCIFDNIPLTAILIQLGGPEMVGFHWSLVAYAVGFGGSMLWIGSSAGVALGTLFPQVYDTKRWLKPAIIIFVVYNIGFFVNWLVWVRLAPMLFS